MTAPSPAAELRAAARRVRAYAEGTTEGRCYSADTVERTGRKRATWSGWPSSEFDEDEPEFVQEIACGASGVLVEVAGGVEGVAHQVPNWRDGRWIALLSPAVAGPLAAWLDNAAHWAGFEDDEPAAGSPTGHALALARVLLGGAS